MNDEQVGPFESLNHSFIIKVWLEEKATEQMPVIWRGRIIHVPSGDQAHFQQIDAIIKFIHPYLKGMGIEIKS